MELDKSHIISKLMQDYQYNQGGAEAVFDRLEIMDQNMKKDFVQFIETGSLHTDQKVEGYSIDILMKEHGMNAIAAFLTLDWLQREPEKAKESLRKGHDTVV